jgi:phospholipase C
MSAGRPPDHSSRLARGELADEAAAERFASERPEVHLRRRDFLARTAALAGSAGLASLVPAETLVAEAAKQQARRHFPSPRNLPVDTFVVLMMENRSFDHYFGWYPGADGKNEGLSYPDPQGDPVATHHITSDFQGCDFKDPDHSWFGGRHQYDEGKMDGFVQGNDAGTGSDSFAAGYYLEDDLPFIPHAASAYTLYDHWFCSIMASTFPNRHYQWGAQSGGQMSNLLPGDPGYPPGGDAWETIFDRAEKHHLTVTYYNSDIPFAALYGARGIAWIKPIADYYADAAAGTLPDIAFVDPAFGMEEEGLSGDEHPHGDIRVGQAFMSDVVHAFIESPQYKRGMLFIDYDEWGGFFDHVRPHFVPDQRRSRNIDKDFGMTGFRIPGVVVSPWTRGGKVSHAAVTHESILKLISYRYGLGYLNKRHRYASNIGRSIDFSKRDNEPPELPDPETIVATPCPAGITAEGTTARPKPHDMARLETSGYLDRLGFEVQEPTLDRLFRTPDRVRQRLRESTPR